MASLNSLLPEGLHRLIGYRNRFRAIGLSPNRGHSRRYRMALEITGLEMIPRELLTSLKCVVDVGANVGEWSLGMTRLTGVSEVLAFEPNPPVFARLQRNTAH